MKCQALASFNVGQHLTAAIFRYFRPFPGITRDKRVLLSMYTRCRHAVCVVGHPGLGSFPFNHERNLRGPKGEPRDGASLVLAPLRGERLRSREADWSAPARVGLFGFFFSVCLSSKSWTEFSTKYTELSSTESKVPDAVSLRCRDSQDAYTVLRILP